MYLYNIFRLVKKYNVIYLNVYMALLLNIVLDLCWLVLMTFDRQYLKLKLVDEDQDLR